MIGTHAPWAPYVGPGTSSNAGDFLVHEAYGAMCRPVALPVLSVARPPLLRLVTKVRPHPEAVLLGGGTLIGSERYRRPLERVLNAFPSSRLGVLGTGVDDPASHRSSDTFNLERWRPLLDRAPEIGVRGPLSAGLLAELGVVATVVGDPALFLTPPQLSPASPGLVGVCAGDSRRLYGRLDAVIRELTAAVDALGRAGLSVRYFVVWPPDHHVVREIAARSNAATTRTEIVTFQRSRPGEFLSALWETEVMVSMKLHGAILANAALIPTVMLAYQRKCIDHHMAVGRERYTLKTSELSADSILGLVESSLSDQRARDELAVTIGQLKAAWMHVARQTLPSLGTGR